MNLSGKWGTKYVHFRNLDWAGIFGTWCEKQTTKQLTEHYRDMSDLLSPWKMWSTGGWDAGKLWPRDGDQGGKHGWVVFLHWTQTHLSPLHLIKPALACLGPRAFFLRTDGEIFWSMLRSHWPEKDWKTVPEHAFLKAALHSLGWASVVQLICGPLGFLVQICG
jgi:hypothetical protein